MVELLQRTFRMAPPVDLGLTLGPMCRGLGDPCMRVAGPSLWRATRTPEGPATTHFVAHPGGPVTVRAWGPGAEWAIDAAPALVGGDDEPSQLVPRHAVIRDLHRRLAGLRIPKSRAVTEALVPVILEQKVPGIEARRSYRALLAALGDPAPGPGEARLRVPPAPALVAATPPWLMHRWGVEARRAGTLRAACAAAGRLEETTAMGAAEARRRLTAIPGVGQWSAAEVALVALGDPDAVSLGDFHLPHQVCWALAGMPRGDDETMLELLEPYRGQRGRVLRLLVAGGVQAPRFGPRLPLPGIARL